MNIKTLGLAVVAVLAMTAVVASGASAANFTASSYPAAGSGGQTTKHVFTVQGQKVECTEATFTGELAAASEELTITPSYSGCTAFGFIGAGIHLMGCRWRWRSLSPSGGVLYVRCGPGQGPITITGGGCQVHISEQTPSTPTIDFKNEGGTNGVLVTSTVSGIAVNVTSSFPCTLTGGNSTATYTGSTLFKSTEGKSIDVG